MKKFKKFLEKNKVYIIIGVLAVLFIVLSLLVKIFFFDGRILEKTSQILDAIALLASLDNHK